MRSVAITELMTEMESWTIGEWRKEGRSGAAKGRMTEMIKEMECPEIEAQIKEMAKKTGVLTGYGGFWFMAGWMEEILVAMRDEQESRAMKVAPIPRP
jgi:hypothetical protein